MKPSARPKPDKLSGVNPFWHLVHPMPHHPTLRQRMGWHRAHEQHCGCRPLLSGQAAIANKRG